MGNNEIYQQNWNQIETEANGVVQITFRDLFVTFSRASPQLPVFGPPDCLFYTILVLPSLNKVFTYLLTYLLTKKKSGVSIHQSSVAD